MKTAFSLALELLDEAAGAAKRLGDPREREALHDFRVALRRLHTHLKSYREGLGPGVCGKLRKRLLKVLAATSGARDAEVEREWLLSRCGRCGRRARAGIRWLSTELARRRREGLKEARGKPMEDFRRAQMKLRKALAAGSGSRLSAQAAPLIELQAEKLSRRLDSRGSFLDLRRTHKLRIGVKRLRYLIEPFKESRKEAPAVLERLKALQDLLGGLHDGNVFSEDLAKAAEVSAARAARKLLEASRATGRSAGKTPFWPERYGLIEAARAIEFRRKALFAELRRQWLGGKAEPLLAELGGLIEALKPRACADGRGPKTKAAVPCPRNRLPHSAALPRTPAGRPLLSSALS